MLNRTFMLMGLYMLFVSGKVSAQDVEGAFRLSASVPLITHRNATLEIQDTGQEIDSTRTAFGLLESAGISFAYGVNEFITIGCDFDVSYTLEDTDDRDEVTDFTFGIVPMLEFIFITNGRIRPFFDLGLGVGISKNTLGDNDISETDFLVGTRIGLRSFVSNHFSIDPSIGFSYVIGSAEMERTGETFNADTNGFVIGLDLELSGWM